MSLVEGLPDNSTTENSPKAVSQAFFSCEWWDRLMSLSARIFSRARTINISFVLLELVVLEAVVLLLIIARSLAFQVQLL